MAVNKIICNDTVLIDLTQDTITADKLANGLTAHDKTGANIVGTYKMLPMEPLYFDYNIGYIADGAWIYQNPTRTYIDIYEVSAGNRYFYTLGSNVGSRFRTMFTTEDVTLYTSGRVTGTKLINLNNPAKYSNGSFDCSQDGYLLIGKDNVGKQNVKSYVYNATQNWI